MNPLQAKPITPDSGLARSRATKTNAISNISFCYRASLALSSIVLFKLSFSYGIYRFLWRGFLTCSATDGPIVSR